MNKILSSLLFFILGTNLMSCNKEEEGYNRDNIVGTWKMVAEEGEEHYNGIQEYWNSKDFGYDWDYITFTFNEDGTGNDDDMNFTYHVIDNYLFFDFRFNEDNYIWKIILLSKNDLIIVKSFDKGNHYFYTKMTFKKIN